MIIHELTHEECIEVLRRTNVGRLACARADQPYIVPISFYFDDAAACIYSFSTVGQKIEWMRENPKVCMEIDEISDRFHWISVVVTGLYKELLDSIEVRGAEQRALQRFQERSEWWLPGAAKLSKGTEHDTAVVYRIQIDRVSGRRAARPPRV